MSGYDYGNARLRAMKSRLLTGADYQSLAAAGTLDHLLTQLLHTVYKESIEATLGRGDELEAINAALSHHIAVTFRKIRRFFEAPELNLIAALLQRYDVHNIKTILRGLENNVSPGEIRAAQVPIGDLSEAILAQLAKAPDPRTAIDLMASMGLPLARPLVRLRSVHPNAEIPELELALDRWYFDQTIPLARAAPGDSDRLEAALALEADLLNLLTLLRLVQTPAEQPDYIKRFRVDSVRALFIGPGRLSFDTLEQAARQPSPEAAIKTLEATPYGDPLAAGLEAYQRSKRLSTLERHLQRYRLHWRAGLIHKDPLGIGVLLGYMALKINEIGNLRWVAYGINIGLTPGGIIEDVESIL
jgi:V/A-type H+-transporting ATPase subunit C